MAAVVAVTDSNRRRTSATPWDCWAMGGRLFLVLVRVWSFAFPGGGRRPLCGALVAAVALALRCCVTDSA